MRISKAIKEKMQLNVERRQNLLATTLWRPLKKTETIEQEYLWLEAQIFQQLLRESKTSSWWDRMFY